jgi:type I restriction enzyme M protein
VMQDDCYLIADEGWKAETRRLIERKEGKEGKVTEKDRGWVCDLVPKGLIVARFFASEQGAIAQLEADLEGVTAERTELEEEHSGEEGFFADFDKINKASVAARLKEIKAERLAKEEREVLTVWQRLFTQEADLKRSIKEQGEVLDRLAYEKYPQLSVAEVQVLVVEDKWMAKLQEAIAGEVDRISQGLTQRVKVLAERYAQPLPLLGDRVKLLEDKVAKHLEKMGFSL